jgi:hypothetical protein
LTNTLNQFSIRLWISRDMNKTSSKVIRRRIVLLRVGFYWQGIWVFFVSHSADSLVSTLVFDCLFTEVDSWWDIILFVFSPGIIHYKATLHVFFLFAQDFDLERDSILGATTEKLVLTHGQQRKIVDHIILVGAASWKGIMRLRNVQYRYELYHHAWNLSKAASKISVRCVGPQLGHFGIRISLRI